MWGRAAPASTEYRGEGQVRGACSRRRPPGARGPGARPRGVRSRPLRAWGGAHTWWRVDTPPPPPSSSQVLPLFSDQQRRLWKEKAIGENVLPRPEGGDPACLGDQKEQG